MATDAEITADIMRQLVSMATPEAVQVMARHGINPHNAYGIPIPSLRRISRQVGHNHGVAELLWSSGIHEARILASIVDTPQMVTPDQMDRWAADIDSWDVCDECCLNLFVQTAYAYDKAFEWSRRPEEFVKRAGFVLMAALALHDRRATDDQLRKFLPIIYRESTDGRDHVMKGVNWALRQIGKRNRNLNAEAIKIARVLQQVNSRSARWIGTDALRELTSQMVGSKLK